MRYNLFAGVVFAAAMFLIPLMALSGGIQEQAGAAPVSSAPPQAADAQETDVQTPESESSQTAAKQESLQTPVAQVDDSGFRILDERTGKVFEVSAQDYVRGALAAEMPPTFHPEALKAQAVAAHTYALNLKQTRREAEEPDPALKGADFTADPADWKTYTTKDLFYERYGTLADAWWKTICDAADAAYPYIMLYDDEPIVAAYHSMSSGTTEDASNVWLGGAPYLVPVDSFGDTLAPDYTTAETFTADQVRQALSEGCPGIALGDDPSSWLTVEERSPSGYVTELSAGDQTISGADLRGMLGLRSSDFSIACDGSSFTFTVNGYGHGVGLSQYGADYMARQGATFDEILTHYYKGAQLAIVKGQSDA